MTNDHDSDRAARIQTLREAARVERAQTLRRVLRSLLRRGRTAATWQPPADRAVVSECG